MSYTLPEFLAHASALEQEAADRYLELADMMEAHHNLDVAAVFRDMSRFSKMHCNEVEARSGHVVLPKLKFWEYRWRTPPESGDDDGVHYLMTPYHALTYARANEVRGMDYYRSAAEKSEDKEVRRLANEFADEEGEHVAALDKWIARTPRPAGTWEDDPDPAIGQ